MFFTQNCNPPFHLHMQELFVNELFINEQFLRKLSLSHWFLMSIENIELSSIFYFAKEKLTADRLQPAVSFLL